MATAGHHNIIIEKGADFVIEVQVSENGILNKDITNYNISFQLMYADDKGIDHVAQFLDPDDLATQRSFPVAGFILPDDEEQCTLKRSGSPKYTPIPGIDPCGATKGKFMVIIDKEITEQLPTRVPPELDPFSTSWEYFYHIDIDERVATGKSKNAENLRVLRGKCAVRL